MTSNRRRMRSLAIIAVLAVAAVSACVTPGAQWRATTPAPCADSTYLELKTQHPDSLSEREWQRFQNLDNACAEARVRARDDSAGHADGWMGMNRGGMALGVMTALMIVMMFAMR